MTKRKIFLLSALASLVLAGCRDGVYMAPPPDLLPGPDLAVSDAGMADQAVPDQSTPTGDLAGVDLAGADLAVTLPPGAATVRLVDLWPTQTSDVDVVELYAVTAGTVKNIVLQQDLSSGNKIKLSTLPDLAVAAGDTILLHLHAPASVTDETGHARTLCTDPTCRPDAWDVVGNGAASNKLGYSSHVVVVLGTDGSIMDGAAFSVSLASQTKGFPSEVQLLATASQWTACDTPPCTAMTAQTVAVNWSGLANSPDLTGKSVMRKDFTVDTNAAADWIVQPSPLPTPSPSPSPSPED